MLTYSFDSAAAETLYGQLFKCLKNDILSGVIRPGEKLPSKRAFAKNLGISVITVENAYSQLAAEGYIYSIPKKGYYAADITTVGEKAVPSAGNARLSSAKSGLFADFTSNQTSPRSFPFTIWSKIMRKQLNKNREELVTNPPCGGIPELREAIAKHLKEFRGIEAAPERIIIGAGTEYLYGLLIQLLGKKVYAVEEPGYGKIRKIYKSCGVGCRLVGMDSCGVTAAALESEGVDVAHISPSHHFPTGIVMPIGRRYEILGWAAKSDSRYIIEDDYDSEFRLSGRPIPAMQSIDVLGRVIYMNTFTKTLASTARIGYMILPPALTEQFYEKLSFYSCTVSNFEQYTLAEFIAGGYFEKHLNRLRTYFRNKKETLIAKIKSSPVSKNFEIFGEDSGLHFLMKIETGMNDEEICAKAELNGIKIAALSAYYENPPAKVSGILVVNYSSVSEKILEEAVDRLNDALSE